MVKSVSYTAMCVMEKKIAKMDPMSVAVSVNVKKVRHINTHLSLFNKEFNY